MKKCGISKIYSRKRLNINFWNRVPNSFKNKQKIKLTLPYFEIAIIALITCFSIWNSLNPVFEKVSENKAKGIATKITNEETSKVMSNYNYDSFIKKKKDDSGNVQMITANVLKINQVTSDISLNIQNSIEKIEKEKIYIALGSLTSIRILSGLGPKIGINICLSGNVETNLRSEFESSGVNQTIHRVYLDIKTNVDILTSFETIEKSIENQVLILENVIVGEIPSTYYNFQGTDNEQQALRIIE